MKQERRQWIFLRDVYRKGDDSENLVDDISPGQDCGYPRAFRAGPHRTLGSGYHLSVCFITLWQVVNTFEVIQMNFTIIIVRDKDRPAPQTHQVQQAVRGQSLKGLALLSSATPGCVCRGFLRS